MNIFVLDTDPFKCAWMHADVHVNKMILESCQLLSNAHENGPYKKTHVNHPCSIWVRESVCNYAWLYELTIELMGVYFNTKHKFHGCKDVFDNKLNIPELPRIDQTPHVICMPDHFRIARDPVASYRNYYCYKQSMFKRHKMTWKYRAVPSWYEAKSL